VGFSTFAGERPGGGAGGPLRAAACAPSACALEGAGSAIAGGTAIELASSTEDTPSATRLDHNDNDT